MNILVCERQRAVSVVHPEMTIKTYRPNWEYLAHKEVHYYQTYPWACPTLLYSNPERGVLVMRTGRMYSDMPDRSDPEGLLKLLQRLESHGIHHRDVHPGNIMEGPEGPLLIDWESAFDDGGTGMASYDLYGPGCSTILRPPQHEEFDEMWWNATHPESIKNRWGVERYPLHLREVLG